MQHPKPIVGVSDTSLLLNVITARTGMPTFHGPAVLWDWGAENEVGRRDSRALRRRPGGPAGC
ncbi:LD-carboxypeptidase [Streptomyces smyrnaeus]|uniref:LD-carboxypeptidase n=1 Tax=Streptomyces smyrnaeus TaxID=1387713 RepID=UPI0033F5972A